jgi:hypothetical protein
MPLFIKFNSNAVSPGNVNVIVFSIVQGYHPAKQSLPSICVIIRVGVKAIVPPEASIERNGCTRPSPTPN